MRIISGNHRGKTFFPPKYFSARPTTDQAKEGLFNILANTEDFEKIKVLDLFSGTGSISYEFASRGCTDITCVEINSKYADYIKKNAATIDAEMKIYKENVFRFIRFCKSSFDIIFADPPYDLEQAVTLPDLIFEHHLLTPTGVFIIEHSLKNDFSAHPHFKENRHYGKVNFSFFR